MFDFIDKIIAEATAAQIQRKQGSITRLFPTFFDRTKKVASMGGLRLHDINVNTWYFKVHSGTEDDVWYDDVVHFVNVVPLLDKLVKDKRLWIADGSRVDRSKLARRFLDQVDIKLSCSCPAALYWGSDYILSLNKYRAKYGDPENRAPRIRNPKQYGAVCKHMHNVLRVLPFYVTTITKWLTQFYDKDIVGFEAEAKKELSKYKVAGAELGKKKKEKERHPVFAKESKIPKVLVHVTRRENIDSIKKYGLIAVADEVMGEDDTPGVNFVDKKNNDLLPVIPAYDRSYIKVNTEDLNPLKFLDLGSGWYRYLGNISPKYIKVIENESRVKLDEEVATLDIDYQKQIKDYYKNVSKKLTLSTWGGKERNWYKFFLLTDGTIIPVIRSHLDTALDAGLYSGEDLFKVGAVAGYIDNITKEMGVSGNKKILPKQKVVLKNLYLEYNVNKVLANIGNKYWSSDVKSSDHLDYLLTYGKDVEEKAKKLEEDLANISDPQLKKLFIVDKVEDLEVKIRGLERLAKTLDKGSIQSSLYVKIDEYQKMISQLKKVLGQ